MWGAVLLLSVSLLFAVLLQLLLVSVVVGGGAGWQGMQDFNAGGNDNYMGENPSKYLRFGRDFGFRNSPLRPHKRTRKPYI